MYADQNRASLEKDKTVFEAVANNYDDLSLGSRTVKSRAYLSWFNFKGSDQQKPVGSLSGGELNRLALAQVTKAGGNLLLGGVFAQMGFTSDCAKRYIEYKHLTLTSMPLVMNVHTTDELTNDADAFLIRALEDALLSFAGCAVVVSHDISFLNRVATHILAFESDDVPGQVTFFEGNFAAYLEDKRRRLGDTTPSRMKFAKLPAL